MNAGEKTSRARSTSRSRRGGAAEEGTTNLLEKNMKGKNGCVAQPEASVADHDKKKKGHTVRRGKSGAEKGKRKPALGDGTITQSPF